MHQPNMFFGQLTHNECAIVKSLRTGIRFYILLRDAFALFKLTESLTIFV